MNPNKRRAISWAVGIFGGGLIYLLFLRAPEGTNNALTLVVTIGAVYLVTLLALEWKYRGSLPGPRGKVD